MTLDEYGPDGRQYLDALASRWRHHTGQAAAARLDLIDKVREHATRGVSEYELARLTGVSRGTIRAWLGK